MIQAVMLDTIVEVEISGNIEEFAEDLGRFKGDINSKDRDFHSYRRVWVVRNPDRYEHVSYIKAAMDNRQRQLTLF